MLSSRRAWFVLCGLLALLLPPADSLAATPGSKVQIPVTTSPKRWPDVGYDAQNNVYLAVIGSGSIQGRFLSANGTLLAGPLGTGTFTISTVVDYHQSPRVACGGGVCAVFWGQGSPVSPMVRLVSYTTGFVGQPFSLSATPGMSTEVGHGISFGDNEFVPAWTYNGSVKFARINLAGQLLQSTVLPAAAGWKSGAQTVYNPTLDEVVLSFAGTKTINGIADTAFVSVQRIQNGSLLGGVIDLVTGGSTYLPHGEFNPTTGSVLVAYYKSSKFYGREVGAGGALGPVTLLSSLAAYDAIDLAYNANASRFLLVTHGPTAENMAVEITSGLVPSPYFTLTSNGGTGNYNPRVVSHATEAKWLAVTSNSFKSLWGQFALGSTCTSNCGGGSESAALSLTSLTPNQTFPITAGTSVTFTATSTGGAAPVQYKFWALNSTSGWTMFRDYATSNSATYTPPFGTNTIQVWARNAGSSADYDAWMASDPFQVVGAVPVLTGLSRTPSTGPLNAGSPVSWTAQYAGGDNPQFKFWLYDRQSARWLMARDYASSPTYTWIPSAEQAGEWVVQVWARNAGSSATYQSWIATDWFRIESARPAISDILMSTGSIISPGTPIQFTALGRGGTGPLVYRFMLYDGSQGDWSQICAYSTSNLCTWVPDANDLGPYVVQAWVKHAGSSADYEASKNSIEFVVTPITSVSLAVSPSGTTFYAGNPLTLTASATGGSGYEYQFWRYDVDSAVWSLAQPWSNNNVHQWTPTSAPGSLGTFVFQVWVRTAGSSTLFERWLNTAVLTVLP